MTKEEAIEVEGLVLEILWWGKYKVQLVDMDMEVEAYAAGKMKRFRIKIIPGDLVTVELNPYEPTKWRIVYRTINKTTKKKSTGGIISQDAATGSTPSTWSISKRWKPDTRPKKPWWNRPWWSKSKWRPSRRK